MEVESNSFINQPSDLAPVMAAIVAGSIAMLCAKMMGITPDMLTFIGR